MASTLIGGVQWSSGLRAGLPIERFGVQILPMAEIWIEISAPLALPSQISYDKYTDCTQSVGKMIR